MPNFKKIEQLTLKELEERIEELREWIMKLEKEVNSPLEQDLEHQHSQPLMNRLLQLRFLQNDKEKFASLEKEIKKRLLIARNFTSL